LPTYDGCLKLTWTNKSLRLLAHEDGSYEWVSPSDYRVAEVRLLHDAGAVGEVHAQPDRAKDNLLIRGDALNALTSLIELPEFAREYVGKVKLAYLDPPFNTQQSFLHYDDALEHSVWLTMMRDRLVSIKTLLSPDGSVWVHCDDSEMAYLKVMMDEVFGRENFVASVIWHRTRAPKNSARQFSLDADYLLVYSLAPGNWQPNLLPRTEAMNAIYKNPDNDPRGLWFGDNLTARNYYSLGSYTVVGRTGRQFQAAKGRYWAVSEERMRQLDADGRIWWGREGNNMPTLKRFLSEVKEGRTPSNVWPPEEVGFVRNGKQEIMRLLGNEPFATPKPESLMYRIIPHCDQTRRHRSRLLRWIWNYCGRGPQDRAPLGCHREGGGHDRGFHYPAPSKDCPRRRSRRRDERNRLAARGRPPHPPRCSLHVRGSGWPGLPQRVGHQRHTGRGDGSPTPLRLPVRPAFLRSSWSLPPGRDRRSGQRGRGAPGGERPGRRPAAGHLRHRHRPGCPRRAPRAAPRLQRPQDSALHPAGVPAGRPLGAAGAAGRQLEQRRPGGCRRGPGVTVAELASEPFDLDRIEAIAARLDLREPNKDALASIVFETVQH